MSIDRRLREAFLAAGQEMDEAIDVEHHLRRAVTRARPREIGRAAATVVLLVTLVAGVFAAGVLVESARRVRQPLDGGPSTAIEPGTPVPVPPTALDGIYSTRLRPADGRAAGLSRADAFGISGALQLWFSRDTVRIEQSLQGLGQVPVRGTIEVNGRRLVVHQEGETLALDWRRLPNGDVRFMVVADTRVGVEGLVDVVVWTSHPWRLIQP
jgi:hypothetical protein